VFKMAQFRCWVRAYCIWMKIKELTPKQLISVPCPTCGVPARRRCVLLSGAPRFSPHVDRRLSAAEAVERKKLKGSLLEGVTQFGSAMAT
jgi:hypothetical protein